MTPRKANPLLGPLRRLFGSAETAALSDRCLLRLFSEQQDEEAFAVLVQRHGPMVLSLCRRLIGHAHEAEDAFQATFCVLARRAAAVGWHDSIGNWLYGVAYRVATRARLRAARHRQQEKETAAMRPASTPASDDTDDLRAALDDEMSRVPEKYRAPLVLCYLQGQTNEEAAQQLGWPKGTVQGRLHRGRELLRARLLGRGLALSAAASLGLEGAAPAAVPSSLVESTVRTAFQFSADAVGAGQVSAPVAALAKGVLRTMTMTRLKIGFALLLVVGFAGGIGAVLWHGTADSANARAAVPNDGANAPVVHAVVPFAGGILDPDGNAIYVMNTDGGIDALNLKTGELLWKTEKGSTYWPMAVVGNRLIARMRDKGVRIAVLDVDAKGKRLLASEPLTFPAWLGDPYPWFEDRVIGGRKPLFTVATQFASENQASKEALVIHWQATQKTTDGLRGPIDRPGIDKDDRPTTKEAWGSFTVDLTTGTIKTVVGKEGVKPDKKLAEPKSPNQADLGDRTYGVEEVASHDRGSARYVRTLKVVAKGDGNIKDAKVLWRHPLKSYTVGFAP